MNTDDVKTKAMMMAFAQTFKGNDQGDAKAVAHNYGCREVDVRRRWDALEEAERNALLERYGNMSKGVLDMAQYAPILDECMSNFLKELLDRSRHPEKMRDQDLRENIKLVESMQKPIPSVRMVHEAISDGDGTLVKLRKSVEYQMSNTH